MQRVAFGAISACCIGSNGCLQFLSVVWSPRYCAKASPGFAVFGVNGAMLSSVWPVLQVHRVVL